MSVTVRAAVRADARAIATIRARSWQAAYTGLIDAHLLAALDVDREAELRGVRWEQTHADPRHRDLIAERGGLPVGWAATGPCRDPGSPRRHGELYAIYAVPEAWSTGVGHALIAEAERTLRRAGFRTASLWMLEGNDRAGRFYRQHGWRLDGAVQLDERITAHNGTAPVREVRRVRDLSVPTAEPAR